MASQPIFIPEIPPFRKNSHHSQLQSQIHSPQITPSPPKLPEIPPFKPRKSTEWTPAADHVINIFFKIFFS